MTTTQPFLGSKITLISKASIRYEGILFSIDTKNSTVALSKVRSFGTENRPCEKEVPPRDEVFEYIIFRGSDIHDLHVCEAPRSEEPQLLQQDPAIVTISQTTLPTMDGRIHSPKTDDMTYSQQHSRPHQQIQSQKHVDQGIHDPTTLGSTQLQSTSYAAQRPNVYLNSNASQKQVSPTPLLSASELNHANREPYKASEYSNYRMQAPSNNLNSTSSNRPYVHRGGYGHQGGYSNEGEGGFRPRGGGHYSNGATRTSGGGYYEGYGYGNQEAYPRTNYRYNSAPRYNAEMTGGGVSSGGYRGGYRYGSNTYTPRYDSFSYRHSSYPVSGNNRQPTNRQQYKDDYDFETENAKIADELAKLGIGQIHKSIEDEEIPEEITKSTNTYLPPTERESNQPHASGDKSEETNPHFYDKTKSFFDTISSESVDRANGVRITQMNRNEERRVNVETFGSTGNHGGGYGGNFRGRGGPRKDMVSNYYSNRGGMYYGPRRGAPMAKAGGGWSSRIQTAAQY